MISRLGAERLGYTERHGPGFRWLDKIIIIRIISLHLPFFSFIFFIFLLGLEGTSLFSCIFSLYIYSSEL